MEISIDLHNATDEQNVLQILGESLGYNENKFWGKNWDALNDILGYLDTGGIWGDNQIFSSPILLQIAHFQAFKKNNPQRFIILNEILQNIKEKYVQKGLKFDFMFIE